MNIYMVTILRYIIILSFQQIKKKHTHKKTFFASVPTVRHDLQMVFTS